MRMTPVTRTTASIVAATVPIARSARSGVRSSIRSAFRLPCALFAARPVSAPYPAVSLTPVSEFRLGHVPWPNKVASAGTVIKRQMRDPA